MTHSTKILAVRAALALFVLILGMASFMNIFNPAVIAETAGFNPETNYGLTNMRTLGAPTLVLSLIGIAAFVRLEWTYILPLTGYFFFNGSARVISVIIEGFEPVMTRGLFLTFGLFTLSVIALLVLKSASSTAQGSVKTAP